MANTSDLSPLYELEKLTSGELLFNRDLEFYLDRVVFNDGTDLSPEEDEIRKHLEASQPKLLADLTACSECLPAKAEWISGVISGLSIALEFTRDIIVENGGETNE